MKRRSVEYHRKPIRVLNSVMRGLNQVGLARTALDENTLIARARNDTGLADFGADDRFMTPFRLILEGLETEARLNPSGRLLARINLLRLLRHRLLVQDLLVRHPEILERDLGDPVVIVGLARSGTTRLHRLLAADERFLHLRSWESVNPVPYAESFKARDEGRPERDPRVTAIEKGLKAVLYMSPQVAAVHPLGAHEVEEEVGLLQHGFSSQIFEFLNRLPTFGEWLMNHDQVQAYEYMVVLLKIIHWFRDDPQGQPWVLKTPQHMQDLDALVRVFPGARLIFPHRDPVKVMGSLCSTCWNSIVRDSDHLTPEWVGPEWLDKVERMLHKTAGVRESQVAPGQQVDILYADITADWQLAMARLYDFLGMPFTDQARQGMQAWLNRNARHKHGEHKYALTDFGLDEQQVEQRLQFYRRQFDIPHETRNPHTRTNEPEDKP